MEITNRIIECYLACEYKAHLTFAGITGHQSEFEKLEQQRARDYRPKAEAFLLQQYPNFKLTTGSVLVGEAIRQGHPLILNTHLTFDNFSFQFPALLRNPNPTPSKKLQYIPILFVPHEKLSKRNKLLLTISALILDRQLKTSTNSGILLYGTKLTKTTIQLSKQKPQARSVLKKLEALQCNNASPGLYLNDHCSICEYRQHCRRIAEKDDHLSLLRGLSKKEITRLNKKGIFTVTQYSYTYRPRKRPAKFLSVSNKHHPTLNALAIRTDSIYITHSPELPASKNRIYLDIEGIPDRDFYYLIGGIIYRGDVKQSFASWVDDESCEADLWQSFSKIFESFDDCVIFHYGSYDIRALTQLCRRYGGGQILEEQLIAASHNVLSSIYGAVYFPCYANDLKSIASALEFSWSHPDASGLESIVWRRQWEASKSAELKNRLIQYNHEDCLALKVVTDALFTISQEPANNDGPLQKPIIHTNELKPAQPYALLRTSPYFPELELINRCAYFEYQRYRVFVRTSIHAKKSAQRKARLKQAKNHISQEVVAEASSHCSHCRSTNLLRHNIRTTIVYDLKFTANGVKRWNVRFKSSRYFCKDCRKVFTPKTFRKFSSKKYGHGLLAWCVYNLIELRQSGHTVVDGLHGLFGQQFHQGLASKMKTKAAVLYEPAYSYLKEKVRSAQVVYADETPMKIKENSGYVWAFSTMEEVVYVYSSTREGTLVKDLLTDFNGILVSDFYAAYDSIECGQQKCLIHLLRDINSDLFRNPFDQELKELARAMTNVMVPIVETIDKYGLKKRHLGKFTKNANTFLETIAKRQFDSELAQGYQKRMTKYRDKLFLFLNHDNVAWNNNNAEQAIKRFAILRRIIGGASTAKGVQEYLVLLSISETLRRKNLSFLKFLQSQSTDLGGFIGNS